MSIINITKTDFMALPADVQTILCEVITALEMAVLPDDAWTAVAVSDSLQQFGAGVLLDVGDGQADVDLLTILADLNLALIRGYCIYQAVFEVAEIHRVGTAPSYMRQGVAIGIIDTLQNYCRSVAAERILLEVRADNLPAIYLYQSIGFGQIDKRVGYYQIDQGVVDALILQLDL